MARDNARHAAILTRVADLISMSDEPDAVEKFTAHLLPSGSCCVVLVPVGAPGVSIDITKRTRFSETVVEVQWQGRKSSGVNEIMNISRTLEAAADIMVAMKEEEVF